MHAGSTTEGQLAHKYYPPVDHGYTWWQRWERCQVCGKRGYPNRKVARAIRRNQVQCYGEKVSELNVYKCESGLFHVGHPSKVR